MRLRKLQVGCPKTEDKSLSRLLEIDDLKLTKKREVKL